MGYDGAYGSSGSSSNQNQYHQQDNAYRSQPLTGMPFGEGSSSGYGPGQNQNPGQYSNNAKASQGQKNPLSTSMGMHETMNTYSSPAQEVPILQTSNSMNPAAARRNSPGPEGEQLRTQRSHGSVPTTSSHIARDSLSQQMTMGLGNVQSEASEPRHNISSTSGLTHASQQDQGYLNQSFNGLYQPPQPSQPAAESLKPTDPHSSSTIMSNLQLFQGYGQNTESKAQQQRTSSPALPAQVQRARSAQAWASTQPSASTSVTATWQKLAETSPCSDVQWQPPLWGPQEPEQPLLQQPEHLEQHPGDTSLQAENTKAKQTDDQTPDNIPKEQGRRRLGSQNKLGDTTPGTVSAKANTASSQAITALEPVLPDTAATPTAPSTRQASAQVDPKEQMEAEVRAALEKLRQADILDPVRVTEIWEQFRKVQTGIGGTPSQNVQPTASPPTTSTTLTTTAPASLVNPSRLNSAVGSSHQRQASASRPSSSALQQQATTQAAPAPTDITNAIPGLVADGLQNTSNNPSVSRTSQKQVSTPTAAHIDLQSGYQGPQQGIKSPEIPSQQSLQLQRPHPRAHPPTSAMNPQATLWPESRRHTLASVAKTALEAIPDNRGKSINVEDVQQLLNQNPSYEQLCQVLEGQGWKFDRGKFARSLLVAIGPQNRPGLRPPTAANTSKPLAPLHSPNTSVKPGVYHFGPHLPLSSTSLTPSSRDVVMTQTKSALPIVPPATAPISAPNVPHQMPRSFNPPAASPLPGITAPPPGPISAAKPQKRIPLPATPQELKTKEEAARKRTFADIVDLTGQDEDDEGELELERQRRSQAIEQPQTRFVEKPVEKPALAPYMQAIPATWQQTAARFDRFRDQVPTSRVTSARENLRNEIVARPIDSAKAKRVSTYDPRTIARDFLLAKGEHPTEKPLNWHLETLFNTFKHVQVNSDLETIRWDLIDPGDPELPLMKEIEVKRKKPIEEDETMEGSGRENANIAKDDGSANEVIVGMLPSRKPAQARAENPEVAGSLQDDSATPVLPTRKRLKSRSGDGTTIARGFDSQPEGETKDRHVSSHATSVRGKRGRPRGRPSRGRGITRPNLSTSQHDLMPERNPTATPTSFIPLQQSSSSGILNSTRVSPSNAIDISASDVVAPSGPSSERSGNVAMKDVPSTPRSGNFSIVIPTGSPSISLPLQKNGQPPKFYPSGKRIGRPIGAKNKSPGTSRPTSAFQSAKNSPSFTGSGDVPRRRGRPPGFRPTASRGRGHVRAAGRPRVSNQIRTTMPPDGIGVIVPYFDRSKYRLNYVEPLIQEEPRSRRWGKDDGVHHPNPSLYVDTDCFPPFPCRWHACTSQLHNLSTLKMHVQRVHLRKCTPDPSHDLNPSLVHECLWYGCCDDSHYGDGTHANHKAVTGGPIYPSLAELEDHIEQDHLREVAEKLGDGPNVKPEAHDPSLYLCDPRTGVQVTPQAANPGDAPPDPILDLSDPAIPREHRIEFIKAYHRAHGNITKAAKARADILSRRAWAADEDRLRAQGRRAVMQMNMNGVRVEVPLSEEARRELGFSEGNIDEEWRDGGNEEAGMGRGTEMDDEEDESRSKIRSESGQTGDGNDALSIATETDSGIHHQAHLQMPGRAGAMGLGMLAPTTIRAPSTPDIGDSENNGDVADTIELKPGENLSTGDNSGSSVVPHW